MTRSRFVGAGTQVSSLTRFDMPGRRNNRSLAWGGVWNDGKASTPAGYTHPTALLLAISPGGISSFGQATGSATLTASLVGGRNGEITITASGSLTATGSLIASGACAITASATLAGAVTAAAQGACSITATGTLNATIGALAGAVCTITATGSTTGTLTGLGHMEAEILPNTELSPAALAAAVWSATATAFDDDGTMGSKMNAAGGAADPWDDSRALTVARFLGLK